MENLKLAGYVLLSVLSIYPFIIISPIAIICACYFRDGRPLLWIPHAVVEVPLWLLGWPLVWIATLRSAYKIATNDKFPGRLLKQFRWNWLYLYCNDEDGVDGLRGGSRDQNWWLTKTKALSEGARVRKWSCMRNPNGNLRFIKPFGFIITSKKVWWIGNSASPDDDHAREPDKRWWYYATHGLYSGYWINTKRIQLRVGWKIMPNDGIGVDPTDYRSKGCAFTFQAHPL